jgi:hypothetical protein
VDAKGTAHVTFSTAGSQDGEGGLSAWAMDYGDTSSASGSGPPPETLTHTYGEGTWTAKLTVTDDHGQTGERTVPVHVGPPDKAPFSASLGTLLKKARLKQARSGLPVDVTCSAACNVRLALSISRKDARRARLKGKATNGRVVVGSAGTAVLSAGTKQLKLRISATAAKRLRRLGRVSAKLAATFTPADGPATTVSRTMTLI